MQTDNRTIVEYHEISVVFTSGYVNTETILHFFYKITNERGTKTVSTYAHVKWFYGQAERAYYLNYFINLHSNHYPVSNGINSNRFRCVNRFHVQNLFEGFLRTSWNTRDIEIKKFQS